MALAVTHRRSNAQLTLRRSLQIAQRQLRLGQTIQQQAAVLVIELPRFGQGHPSRGAEQQLTAETLLQRPHLTAHLRGRQPKLHRRRGKTAGFRHRHKLTDALPLGY